MKLEAFLSSRGLRPYAFAIMAGVPPSTISRILRGERQPGIGVIAKIVAASGGEISADDFLSHADVHTEDRS